MWPRKYGWLNFAILECSLNVWIVNKTVFAAPELREKCAAKSEAFSSLLKMTSQKQFLAEISNINIFHIAQYFWVKRYKRNQWNLPNILTYISGIFDDFFKGGLVPLKSKEYHSSDVIFSLPGPNLTKMGTWSCPHHVPTTSPLYVPTSPFGRTGAQWCRRCSELAKICSSKTMETE